MEALMVKTKCGDFWPLSLVQNDKEQVVLAIGSLSVRIRGSIKPDIEYNGNVVAEKSLSKVNEVQGVPPFETFLLKMLRDQVSKRIEQMYKAHLTGPAVKWNPYPSDYHVDPIKNKNAAFEFDQHTQELLDRIKDDLELILRQHEQNQAKLKKRLQELDEEANVSLSDEDVGASSRYSEYQRAAEQMALGSDR